MLYNGFIKSFMQNEGGKDDDSHALHITQLYILP